VLINKKTKLMFICLVFFFFWWSEKWSDPWLWSAKRSKPWVFWSVAAKKEGWFVFRDEESRRSEYMMPGKDWFLLKKNNLGVKSILYQWWWSGIPRPFISLITIIFSTIKQMNTKEVGGLTNKQIHSPRHSFIPCSSLG